MGERHSIAVAMINRTPPCYSRAGGNPPPHLSSRWIPACAGMTLACPKLYDYGYKEKHSSDSSDLG